MEYTNKERKLLIRSTFKNIYQTEAQRKLLNDVRNNTGCFDPDFIRVKKTELSKDSKRILEHGKTMFYFGFVIGFFFCFSIVSAWIWIDQLTKGI